MEMSHLQIESAFHACFRRVKLKGGALEPLYLPAAYGQEYAQIHYREDFAASALHEIAHWCIAGERRRQLVDFGYGYVPPPRTKAQQLDFFKLELKTQALESIFSAAAQITFQVSADNLETSAKIFACQVELFTKELHPWLQRPSGARARRFLAALGNSATERSSVAYAKDEKWTA